MGLFTGIMNKIFGHKAEAKLRPLAAMPPAPATAPSTPAPTSEPPTSAAPPQPESPPPAAAAPPAPAPVVDVAAVLDDLAAATKEKLDWRKSIVDLMKLVGMDSSLASRKELADDLGYTGDKGDSAKMNVWLHREVIKKLAANGGMVPADLLD